MPGISKTVVSLKSGSMEGITKFIDEKSDEINQTAGGLGFAVAVTGEDEITIIAIYESSQKARDAGNVGRWICDNKVHSISVRWQQRNDYVLSTWDIEEGTFSSKRLATVD